MSEKKTYLGIDIGSVAVSVVLLNATNDILYSSYTFHSGQVTEHLTKALDEIDFNNIKSIAYTSSTPKIINYGSEIDSRVAYISAAKYFNADLSHLLIIGAEKFGLVTFDENGEYRNYKSNTSCAAGTGSFLDQQAKRLNLDSIMHFSNLAYDNKGEFPKIASRCAVFAKTDLIHAQQEGYSLSEICDGLSFGLAKNIVDTVPFNGNVSTVVASGGVSKNMAVVRHIENLTGAKILVNEYSYLYGAIGAALQSKEKASLLPDQLINQKNLVDVTKKEKKYHYEPLELKLSKYPDFASNDKYEYKSVLHTATKPVEIDIYITPQKNKTFNVYLGIDIGSTSTKALLLNDDKQTIAGLYTRTSGQPIQAVQVIFEAIKNIEKRYNIAFKIIGTGTTGSGRKFVGKIIGADIILDEITAHARAAYELDPETDTVIEIGGQDSKFTVMRNGMVTFSVMNNVCAAGTGSFIEELARKLNCPLSDYSSRAEQSAAPLASDRCTVFMERDLNHYLNEGYSIDEILASVLHSIRENYLTKVAVKGSIGNKIFFQGATAKNKALVAAFEQRLGKPIMVSEFCHLTGAMGTALELHDSLTTETKFRGLELYKTTIPMRTEVCELCTNHCKLKVAEINNETEAYGFLCGRDYNTNKYVKSETVDFELIKQRKAVFDFKPTTKTSNITIGIPAGLYLVEETSLWRDFFDILSIKTITSENYTTALADGKNISGAEFCGPISAMYGHVDYLKTKADYIFLPVYLEETSEIKIRRHYCYYTQFVTTIISVQSDTELKDKILSPLIKSLQSDYFAIFDLYKMIKAIGISNISYLQVSSAYDKAKKRFKLRNKQWKALYEENIADTDDIHIMMLGRPYTILSPSLNSHIPDIIAKNGIKAFLMDMLPNKPSEIPKVDKLVKTIKWKIASDILLAAEIVAKTDKCYPVLITSFKCTPDSFVVEYFKEIFDTFDKPYLILQLDEHDSSVGYETRIEAAIRAFKNHYKSQKSKNKKLALSAITKDKPKKDEAELTRMQSWEKYVNSMFDEASVVLKNNGIDFKRFKKTLSKTDVPDKDFKEYIISGVNKLKNKILLLPSWDTYVGPLLQAILTNAGIDARLLDESNESIQKSLSYNTGQCLPLNIIVQNTIDYVQKNNLDPANTVLWMSDSNASCNFGMFPHYMKKLLNDYGNGIEKVSVYLGHIMFMDISLQTCINAYLAYNFGGNIRKAGCRIRPYEIHKGSTEKATQKSLALLYDMFKNGKPKEPVIKEIISSFEAIEVKPEKEKRPKVAIFGDMYVRDNDIMNQNLIKTIEDNGGEVITTPYSEYMKIIAPSFMQRFFKEGMYIEYAKMRVVKSIILLIEEKYNKFFDVFFNDPEIKYSDESEKTFKKFNLNVLQRGETIENVLKIIKLVEHYPDIELLVSANPAYCCPSMVTEALASKIEETTGVPLVFIEYDGTGGVKNEDVIPYLKYRKKSAVDS